MGTTPPQATASLPPNGGNGVIRTTTRRRHADSQLLVVQNPHRSQPRALRCIQDRRRVNYFALAPPSGRAGRQISRTGRSDVARLKPMTPLRPLMQTNVKPPSPLRALEQQALKPMTPLRPKTRQNPHFSPAKAMAVSTGPPHRPAKATPVSDNRTPGLRAPAAPPWRGLGFSDRLF